MKLFLQKKCKIFERWGLRPHTPVPPAAGGFAPKPPASGGWGLRPQTPIGLRRLGAPPPDPQNSPPHCEFLATRLAMIRPIMFYACVSWAGGLNKKFLVRKLTKMQRLAGLMISLAFPGTLIGALKILFNITPIEEFLLAEAVRGSYRITVSGLWHVHRVGSFGKTKSHADVCNEAGRFLSLLQMPTDRMKKTKGIR